jgi:hypothetical protein
VQLGPLPASADVLEVAADVAALLDGHAAAQQERRHHPAAKLRIVVDLVGDQLAEDEGALRVADQDDASAVVVLAQVLLPCLQRTGVGDALHARRDLVGVEDRPERELAIHRREDPALLRVAGRLVQRD